MKEFTPPIKLWLMIQIHVKKTHFCSGHIRLEPAKYHHIIKVNRLKIGDLIDVIIDEKTLVKAQVSAIELNGIRVAILDQWSIEPYRKIPITVIQSIGKQDKLTTVCKLVTSVGASHIYPVISDYCIARSLSEQKFNRIQTTIQSAADQSKQRHLPIIHSIQSLDACLQHLKTKPHGLKCVAYEHSKHRLQDAVKTHLPTEIILAVGPEGGYSDQDMALFNAAGFSDYSFGTTIIRTEYAAFAAIYHMDGYFESMHP